eukprot:scaffold288_cov97-Cylindrotheca_fusiformis.AAC.4
MSQGGNHNPSSSRRPMINNPYAASNNNNNNRNTGNRQQQQQHQPYHHPMAAEAAAAVAPVPPTQPAAEPMALDPIGTNNTNLQESTTTAAAAEAADDLKEQLKALRQELMAQSEANFELNATIATMQAEMTHTIQTSEQKHKQEASKLNHLLRLEQLKSQQLEQQQQYQYQYQRKKQRASMDSVFSKRPLGGSIPPPPPITTTVTTNPTPANDLLSTESPVSPTPPPITTTTTTTTTFKNQQEATRRLAQQLLQTTTDTSSQQQQYPNQIRQVLMDIIAIRKNHSSSSLFVWNEIQLVEYLLRETKQQGALEFCTIALQQCRPARMAIQKAITTTTTTTETTTFSAPPTTSQPETTTTTRISSNRIRPMQSPLNNNENEASSFSSSQEIATTRQMVLTALQDPWWNDDDDDDSVLPLSLGNLDATTTTTTTIPSPLVKDWVRRLIFIDNDSTNTATTMNRVVGLQALHVLLTEQSYYTDHSQTEWWNLCHSSLEQVLEQIHSRQFQKTTISTSNHNNQTTSTELHHSSRMAKPTTKISPLRRLQVVTNENYNNNNDDDDNDETIHEILARSLSIFAKLIQITQIPLLEKWYSSNDEEGHDGHGGSRMVSLVLDLLEAHSHAAGGGSSSTDEKKQPAPRTIIQRPDMEGWYLDAIRFLSVVGSTHAGMVILRTRTRPAVPTDASSSMTNSGDGVWMGNALDVAIRQLFTLVMDQEEQSIAEQETDGDRIRTLAIEGWVRLWHQVLLFVQQQQQQQQPDKQPPAVDISFRSLVLEHQNWYTSACAMLLTNDSTRPEIQSMIRLQLEELSMDEEEYEELKEQ